jgi:putative hydrolase of the HAD superfamily
MIKRNALLLDFGGVITRTLFECRGEIERHFALPGGSLCWRGALDPASDELWRAMLAGKISDQEYWRHRIAALGQIVGRALEMADIIAAIFGADPNLAIRPEAMAAVHNAKAAGCRIGVLSNDLELIYGRDALSRMEIFRELDCVVDGSRSRVRKPSPEAFARGLAALGSTAQGTVFVDDQPRNVAGAITVGMAGVVFDICDPACSFGSAEQLLGI